MSKASTLTDRPFRFRLDLRSGVPVYRQLIDQVLVAISSGTLGAGDRLPTVRQVAVDLSININTVVRAYKELEIRGMLSTQQGTGTFVTDQEVRHDEAERQRRLSHLIGEMLARAGAEGFSIADVRRALDDVVPDSDSKRR
jgi:GntR family transcriptional regulator